MEVDVAESLSTPHDHVESWIIIHVHENHSVLSFWLGGPIVSMAPFFKSDEEDGRIQNMEGQDH